MGTYPVIAAVAALLVFRLYRRGRKLIGEQVFDRRRMSGRLIVLAVVLVFLLYDDWSLAQGALLHAGAAWHLALLYTVVGIAGGIVLGVWAARLATFRFDADKLKYRGHVWFGPAILLLYVGRLVYRFWLMQRLGLLDGASYAPAHLMQMQHELALYVLNPFSALLRGLVFAYYFAYYPLLMRRAAMLQASAASVQP